MPSPTIRVRAQSECGKSMQRHFPTWLLPAYISVVLLNFATLTITPAWSQQLGECHGSSSSCPPPPDCPTCDECPPEPQQCDRTLCPASCHLNDCETIVRLYAACVPPTATPTVTPTPTPPTVTYRWRAQGWSDCKWDLRGKRERTVTCINQSTGEVVDNSLCTDVKPPRLQNCDICERYPGQYISGVPGRQKHDANNGGVSSLGDPSTQSFFWNSSPPAPDLPTQGARDNYFHDLAVANRACKEAFGSSTIYAVGGRDLYEHVNASPLNNDQWYLNGGRWTLDTSGRDVFIKGLDCVCP